MICDACKSTETVQTPNIGLKAIGIMFQSNTMSGSNQVCPVVGLALTIVFISARGKELLKLESILDFPWM